MKRIKPFLPSIVFFIGGVLLTAVVDSLFGKAFQLSSAILIFTVVIFALCALYILTSIQKTIDGQVDKLGGYTIWITDQNEVYKKAENIVRSAKKSIYIVNAYSPAKPKLHMPIGRNTFITSIEEIVEKYVSELPDSDFVYSRVLQIDKAIDTKGILKREMVNEEPSLTFDHIKRVIEICNGKYDAKIDISFFVSEPIMTIPSILIVDNTYAFINFISLENVLGSNETALIFYGALLIEDSSGNKINDFKRMYDQVCKGAILINMLSEN